MLRMLQASGQDGTKPKACCTIGVDLGTTNSCVGVFRNLPSKRVVDVVSHGKKGTITPSAAYYGSGGVVVGQAALDRLLDDPSGVVYGE